MKKRINIKVLGIAPALIFCCIFCSGCGSDSKEQITSLEELREELNTTQKPQSGDSDDMENNTWDDDDSEGNAGNAVNDKNEVSEGRIAAYRKVLYNIYETRLLPDGNHLEAVMDGDMADNKFAIFDVDNDGSKELVIQYVTASMAGMQELIYDYDAATEEVFLEFSEFPLITYYDNGYIKVDDSHNHGLGMELWPYSVYKYNDGSKCYELVASVDSWEKLYFAEDFNGNPFPSDLDVDGDGILYYIIYAGHTMEDTTPVDKELYEAWESESTSGGTVIDIGYLDFTKENIDSISEE